MKAWIGKALIGIGVVHSIGGFLFFGPILSALFNEGLFNTITVSGDIGREAAFWFLFGGFMVMIIGGLVDRLERLGEHLPAFLGWSFAALTILGAIIMPASGFWLLIIPTIGMIRRRN
ncbi:MAG: molecular chaperone GroEL [Chloroflexi bacterium]|nr:molecular chaperone GroEL [Chloroflexota bacterium]